MLHKGHKKTDSNLAMHPNGRNQIQCNESENQCFLLAIEKCAINLPLILTFRRGTTDWEIGIGAVSLKGWPSLGAGSTRTMTTQKEEQLEIIRREEMKKKSHAK